ncbi:hypothetical protein Cgig2_019029 [Carnegiea gigantea]|uniref:Telomere length regulation protein TEL2 homolog n=1 Tax=Carnegiea gigantea TaxID=171969 RepID=A0A9Q1JPR1_9CARY|nr:hypothetical protein Cgig2_019029 [Carnegiea gigantea]
MAAFPTERKVDISRDSSSRRRRLMAEVKSKRKREVETQLLAKVSDAISAINSAKNVDDVVLALHSVASLIFPIDTPSLSGMKHEKKKNLFCLIKAQSTSVCERSELWQVFYQGAAFPTLARFLIRDVAPNWLSCIPFTARKLVYDVFFVKGLTIEVVQTMIPSLDCNGCDAHDANANAIRSNAERLVELCLLENEGVLHLAREFGAYYEFGGSSSCALKLAVSRVAQLIASVPDKARIGAQRSLSSQYPSLISAKSQISAAKLLLNIAVQLIAGAQERSLKTHSAHGVTSSTDVDGTFQFVGEMFTRICRRGSADLLLSEVTPWILRGVRSFLSSNRDTNVEDCFNSDLNYQFWFFMMEIIKDAYVVERIAEQILHQLVIEHANDTEAYWILWILFHRSFEHQTAVRVMFLEKFLLWKVFPLRCLRWILQFAVFCRPPCGDNLKKNERNDGLLDAVQRVIAVWSKKEFVQSAPLEQQVCNSSRRPSAGEHVKGRARLNQGCYALCPGRSRLENPDELVRRMASGIALVFSKIVDPKSPLYLDDNIREGDIDWEFGLAARNKGGLSTMHRTSKSQENKEPLTNLVETTQVNHEGTNERGSKGNAGKKKSLDYKFVDPDEVIDPATLNDEVLSGEDEDDDNASEDSEASSDSTLQPYDLTDDDSDLRKKFSQLVDVIGALRKPDDRDGVERALDVAEKLVRASPDELRHAASGLVRTLVQVRVSDAAVEGEEESAEEKRQKALVALLVTCPFESVDTINNLLYSPHLDVSQRIMILDVMTDAAQELANTKTIIQKNQPRPLISSASEPQPWFLPIGEGPPGAGSWKEVSDSVTPLSWTHRYERELPLKPGQIKKGKTRKCGHRMGSVQANDVDWSLNKFPLYAAAFMLPAMQGFDKKRHGVDLLGRDFIVLGKLIYMLGVCIKCTTLHPEAFALAPALLDMLSSREVCHHKEAYVRRAVLFAASCTLTALHPSFIASALLEGNLEFSRGLEWVRTWALEVAESDPDRECYSMAMACLQLHAEMSFQASRALESTEMKLQHKVLDFLLICQRESSKFQIQAVHFLANSAFILLRFHVWLQAWKANKQCQKLAMKAVSDFCCYVLDMPCMFYLLGCLNHIT